MGPLAGIKVVVHRQACGGKNTEGDLPPNFPIERHRRYFGDFFEIVFD